MAGLNKNTENTKDTDDTKDNLIGCRIGIQLLSGQKIFGNVFKWSPLSIWVTKEVTLEIIEVPRDIIVRALVLLE